MPLVYCYNYGYKLLRKALEVTATPNIGPKNTITATLLIILVGFKWKS